MPYTAAIIHAATEPCRRRLSCPCPTCQAVREVVDFLIDAPEAAERPAKERRTTHGAVMSPRMARFHWYLDSRKIPIGDWSTDMQVKACLPALKAAFDEISGRAADMAEGISRTILADLANDLAGVMRRVPENRSQGAVMTAEQRKAEAETKKITERAAAKAAKVAAERQKMLIAIDLPSEQTGAVIWWENLAGRTLAEVCDALKAAGVSESLFPAAPSADTMFTRACQSLRARDIIVRSHPKGGYYLLHEGRDAEGNPDPKAGARFQHLDGEVRADDAAAPGQVATVRAAVAAAAGELTAGDISDWLIDRVADIGGVTLKAQAGHFYFIPCQAIGTLRAMKAALDGLHAGDIREMPAMRAAEGVASVLAAVAGEVKAWAEKTEGDMATDKVGGARACASRAAEGLALAAKVKTYEQLLGATMQPALDRISAVCKALGQYTTRGAMLEID